MSQAYKSDTINVTTSPTTIKPDFDISLVSVLPSGGDAEFRMWNANGWGDWIEVPENIAFEETFQCQIVQIKSVSGTVSVNYYLEGAN